jgi:hypothetical protein
MRRPATRPESALANEIAPGQRRGEEHRGLATVVFAEWMKAFRSPTKC